MKNDKGSAGRPEEGPAPAAEPLLGSALRINGDSLAHVAGATINEVSKLALAADAIKVETLVVEDHEIPFAFRRNANGDHVAIDVLGEAERWRLRPFAKKGVAVLNTRDSFVDLVNRHKDDGSALFAKVSASLASILCVFDYHELGGEPRFGRHRAGYSFPFSEDWKRWVAQSGDAMSQREFAEWIEERFIDTSTATPDEVAFYEPALQSKFGSPADLLTLARGLDVHENSRVSNAITLQNGTGQITFESTHVDSTGNTLKVPGIFMLAIPMFDRGEPVRVPVRLRYSTRGGSLSWTFLLYRVEDFVRAAVDRDLLAIREATGLPLFHGQPEGNEIPSFKP